MVDGFQHDHGDGIEQRCEHQRERNAHHERGKRAQRGHAPRSAAVALLRLEERFRIERAKVSAGYGFRAVHVGLRLAPSFRTYKHVMVRPEALFIELDKAVASLGWCFWCLIRQEPH